MKRPSLKINKIVSPSVLWSCYFSRRLGIQLIAIQKKSLGLMARANHHGSGSRLVLTARAHGSGSRLMLTALAPSKYITG
jgi:hypothetical protein